jgi:hypothetical protein
MAAGAEYVLVSLGLRWYEAADFSTASVRLESDASCVVTSIGKV